LGFEAKKRGCQTSEVRGKAADLPRSSRFWRF
jgi:hypothetical protein